MRRLLAEFRDAGGDAHRSAVAVAHGGAVRGIRDATRACFGLQASCGSDFHGPGESWLDLGDLPPLPAGVDAGVDTGRPSRAHAGRSADSPMPARTVFFISDRTGITAEMLGNSLLTQFEEFQFQRRHDSVRRLAGEGRGRGRGRSTTTAAREGRRPIVVQLGRRRSDERDHPARRATR